MKLSRKAVDMFAAAGSVVDKDSSYELLNELVDSNNVTIIHRPWTDLNGDPLTDDEFQKVWADFSKEIFTDELTSRDALTSGEPSFYKFHVKPVLERHPIVKKRIQDVADAMTRPIAQVFSIYYMRVKNKQRAPFHGGTRYHGDDFAVKGTKFRLLDTMFDPLEGLKIFTLRDVTTGETASFTVPHGTMLLLTSLAAGNHGDKYQHHVTGGEGTCFIATDLL